MRRGLGLAVWVGLAGVVTLSCGDSSPTAPQAPPSTVTAPASEGTAAALGEPNAVFNANPAPGGDGVIRGESPLTVTFNMCKSRDDDEGDSLKFTYDYDGDGTVDERGICRGSNTYTARRGSEKCSKAVTCVSDKQPDHNVCHTWEVCVAGAAPAPPTGGPAACNLSGLVAEVEPNEDGTPSNGGGLHPPDPLPEGNDFSTANAQGSFTASAETTINASFSPSGDEDVFAVTNCGATSKAVLFRTRGECEQLAGHIDTVLHIRDASGAVLAEDDDNAGVGHCEDIIFGLAAGQTVYVHVQDYDDNRVGTYTLLIQPQ
jgi:hypothetical protein